MKNIWITYSWEDNKDQMVDFVAQELNSLGLAVKLDKWTISAGNRLWEQIEKFITDENNCDAWIFYITPNSLGSEPCKKEFAYALDRSLHSRGGSFPLIGLSPSNVDNIIIPAAIRTRLYVSLQDDQWKERILASIEKRLPSITRPTIEPYTIEFHQFQPEGLNDKWIVIELRPRVGSWTPSFVGIKMSEKELTNPFSKYGPKGVYYLGGMKYYPNDNISKDGQWWLMTANNEVNTSTSLFLVCKSGKLPTQIAFGSLGDGPQFQIDLNQR